jgi:hypothetical protein
MTVDIAMLSEAQRESLKRLRPDDVDQFAYAPFQGCSQGLFQIAPGWLRMELTPAGRQARALLLKDNSDAG